MTERVQLGTAVTLAPNTSFAIAFNAAKEGYKAVGVGGYSTENRDSANDIRISGVLPSVDGKTIYMLGKYTNQSYSSTIPKTAVVVVQYEKI